MKGAFLCLAHALIIAMALLNGDTNYALYVHGKCMKKLVEDLLKASGVDLSNGGGFEELEQFQENLSYCEIVVYDCLNPDRVMFSGNSLWTRNSICYLMRTIGTEMLFLRYLRLRHSSLGI